MHKAWSSIEEVPHCFWRSSVKFQGHTALKSVEFDPDWEFPDCNSSLNWPMATKWCTELEVITSLTVVYSTVYSDADQRKIKALRHWPLCGEVTGTGEFPTQRASYAENVSIWWRHHVWRVIRQISRSYGSKKRRIWPRLGISGL